VKLVDITGKIK